MPKAVIYVRAAPISDRTFQLQPHRPLLHEIARCPRLLARSARIGPRVYFSQPMEGISIYGK